MRNEMLFIDGELVDMNDNTKITLNYKSNIFSDLSKIVSNNSYTIKLPTTVHNQRIFKHADLPASSSTYPRFFHKARYFRNGVEILSDALAVLISSGGTFDIALTWGNSSVFEPLVKSEKKLNELTDSGEFLVWNKEAGYGQLGEGNYLYSQANYGVDMNASGANVWALPVARVRWVIGLIEKEYGIKMNIPYPQNSLTDSLMIMCDSQKESDEILKKNPVELEFIRTIGAEYVTKFEFKKKDNIQNEKYGEVVKLGQISSYFPRRVMEETILEVSASAVFDSFVPLNSSSFVVIQEEADGTFREELFPGFFIVNSQNIEFSGYIKINTTIDSRFYFEIRVKQGHLFVDSVTRFDIKFYMKSERDVQYNERFPIVPNLIPMKCIDFLKNITQMVGLFAIPDADGKSISFFSVDKIYLNIHKAINVTNRVVAETKENKPRSIKYAIDGLARNNRFDYKKDESVLGDYSGVITVADETIDFEKEAVNMSFAATDTISVESGVTIPLYGYGMDGAIERKSIEPRIFREDWRNMKSALSFFGLEWKRLLKDYYSRYQKVVSSPIIITEKIDLSDIELKELDMTVPFYLGQYGRYYAIISVKAEDTGICECQLLQLEV